jgi:hypothetical protein
MYKDRKMSGSAMALEYVNGISKGIIVIIIIIIIIIIRVYTYVIVSMNVTSISRTAFVCLAHCSYTLAMVVNAADFCKPTPLRCGHTFTRTSSTKIHV